MAETRPDDHAKIELCNEIRLWEDPKKYHLRIYPTRNGSYSFNRAKIVNRLFTKKNDQFGRIMAVDVGKLLMPSSSG